jgi:hypothetical protein
LPKYELVGEDNPKGEVPLRSEEQSGDDCGVGSAIFGSPRIRSPPVGSRLDPLEKDRIVRQVLQSRPSSPLPGLSPHAASPPPIPLGSSQWG